MRTPIFRAAVTAWCALLPSFAAAQSVGDFVPKSAAHCDLKQPPAEAGLIATPGGFLLVYPRNAALKADFTGCKLLWIAETDERYLKFATLYFKDGQLALAASHDARNDPESLEGVCAFPSGKSLLPASGQRFSDRACAEVAAEGFYALMTPSWPRQCAQQPDQQLCREEPR